MTSLGLGGVGSEGVRVLGDQGTDSLMRRADHVAWLDQVFGVEIDDGAIAGADVAPVGSRAASTAGILTHAAAILPP